jgi:hypothetical protein
MTEPRRGDPVRAVVVWIFPLFTVLMTKALLDGEPYAVWPSFWGGFFMAALVGMVAGASWGFWTGRLR